MIDDLIDALLKALEADTEEEEEDETPEIKSCKIEFSVNNKNEEKKPKAEKEPEKKVATGAPPKYTVSFKNDNGKSYEFDGCSLTNDKEEDIVDRTVRLDVPKDFMAASRFEYDKRLNIMDVDAAVLFAFSRMMGEHAGMTGEALESFVQDYAAFLSGKLVDITKEFTIKKLTENLKGLMGE